MILISGRRGGLSGVQIYGNIREQICSGFLNIFFSIFLVRHGIPEVREVSRKLPGARGSAVIEYGPVASHGDHIQPQNYRFLSCPNRKLLYFPKNKSQNRDPISPNSGVFGGGTHLISSAIPW